LLSFGLLFLVLIFICGQGWVMVSSDPRLLLYWWLLLLMLMVYWWLVETLLESSVMVVDVEKVTDVTYGCSRWRIVAFFVELLSELL
jgi:hypothetical protein